MKCKTCGKEFEPTRPYNKYCSKQCRKYWNKHHHPYEPPTCVVCGAEFRRTSSTQKTCSEECRKKHWRKYHTEWQAAARAAKAAQSIPTQEVTCTYCETHPVIRCEFCGKAIVQVHGNHRFCSEECRKAAQAGASTPNYVVPKAVYKKTARSILKEITKELSKLFR